MTLTDHDRAIHDAAAIGATSSRRQIAIAGEDRASYLQGLLTNDIQALAAGQGCYAAWLSPQGRMLTDMHVLQSESLLLLDVPAPLVDATVQRLEQFIFSEDVRVASLADTLTSVSVHGPLAAATLGRVLGTVEPLREWTGYHHERLDYNGEAVVVARLDQLGVPGFCVWLEIARAPVLTAALVAAGAVAVDPAAIEAARIEAGYPVFGVDMTEETIPLEAVIQDRAISLTKGCYVGQEIIIRVLHRGGGRVAKKLVKLRLDGPVPNAGVTIASGERVIGVVTSAARSPRLGTIALGYVHRDFVAVGTEVTVGDSGGRVTG